MAGCRAGCTRLVSALVGVAIQLANVPLPCCRHGSADAAAANVTCDQGFESETVLCAAAPLTVVCGKRWDTEIDHRDVAGWPHICCLSMTPGGYELVIRRRFVAGRATATNAALRRRAKPSQQLYSQQSSHSRKIASSTSNSTLNSLPIVRLQHLIRTHNSSMNETGHTGHRV
jgi:hypothetical protein